MNTDRDPEPCVLVAEDDEHLRGFVSTVLADEGYEVLQASDGNMALELATNRRPHVIFLDLRMPVMDGRRFAHAYQDLPGPHAPIVIFTGSEAVEAAKRTEEIGASGFLRKPFDLEALLAMVRRYAPPRTRPEGSSTVVPAETAASGVGAVSDSKVPREAGNRQWELRRLRDRLAALQRSMAGVRAGTRRLAELEARRRLNPEEARRARQLRWESERLRFEVNLLRDQFEALRAEGQHSRQTG